MFEEKKSTPIPLICAEKPSYYDLLLKANVMLEVQQIALVFSIVSVFFYGSYDLSPVLEVMVQNGLSSCTAQRLLFPFPHLLMSILLLVFFFYRASNYQIKQTDWHDLMEYINHEDVFKDFSTGKIIKRKGRLFVAIFGILLFVAVMPFVFWHLYGYFYGECRDFSEHIKDQINFFESILMLTFPTYLFILLAVFILRGKRNGSRALRLDQGRLRDTHQERDL